MTEQIIPFAYRHEIRCSICGRTVRSRLVDQHVSTWTLRDEHGAQRAREGWRVFAGRSRRWYCPEHGPSRGSTARDVTKSELSR